MGEWSSLPAMDINPVGFGARNRALSADADLRQQQADQYRKLSPLELANEQLDVDNKRDMNPLNLRAKQNQQRLDDLDTGNKVIGQVVRDTMAADQADKVDVWDRGMKEAADSGVKAARQHIGHYRDDLAERLDDVYNGGADGKGGSRGGERIDKQADAVERVAIDRQVAQMKPADMILATKKANDVINSFNKVTDKASWDHELEYLKLNGIDTSGMPAEWSDLNFAAAKHMIEKKLVPYRDSMMERATILGIGAKPPALPQLGKSTLVGTDPGSRKPVYHNAETGEDTRGPYAIEPKARGAMSKFQFSYQAAIDDGMTPGEALKFANGQTIVRPERLEAMAAAQATKDLQALSFTDGIDNIGDKEAWLRSKTAEHLAKLKTAAEQGVPGGPKGGGGEKGGGGLPPRALADLKKHAGKRVTFGKNGTYVWKNGRAVKVE